jgi:hypothetical protein
MTAKTKAEMDRDYYLRNKERVKARANAYYHATAEERLKKQRARYEENKDVVLSRNRAWANANKEKMGEYHLAYVKRNRAKWSAQTAKYRSKKSTATPLWANLGAINEVYELASEWNSLWPDDLVHVDHIVPLQSKQVSGLHCEANLCVRRAKDNRVKSNRYWADKP